MKKKISFIAAALLLCAILSGCAAVDTEGEAAAVPVVHADQIEEGTYAIEVDSSSSMFKVVDAQLTVRDQKMTALLTLSGTGYLKLYMGTGEQAAADADEQCIYYVENPAGQYTYEVPVEALNQEVDCAAWSIRKEKWYDRVLVFESSLIPESAMTEG